VDQLADINPAATRLAATTTGDHSSPLPPVTLVWNGTEDPQVDGGHGARLAADITLAILLSLIVVFAVAGNLLVIAAILTDRALRQTGNYFLVSLALADTLVAVAVMTFAVANDVMGRWLFGSTLCDIWLSADVMCSTASILNLCAVSLDRYLHIRRYSPYLILAFVRKCNNNVAGTYLYVYSQTDDLLVIVILLVVVIPKRKLRFPGHQVSWVSD